MNAPVSPCAARLAAAQDITDFPINHLATCPGNSRGSVRRGWLNSSCNSGGWRVDASSVGWSGGVVVRSGVAGRGARVAGGSGGAGWVAFRSDAFGAGGGGVGCEGAGVWAADDPDRAAGAVDGDQAPLRVGV